MIAFPVLLFLIGTLYLGGDLGKNLDDYALNQRDPATGVPFSSADTIKRYFYFWRPLHLVMLFGGGTYLSDHPTVWHWFCAAFHGLASFGLFSLLRRATATWHAPAAASLVFLTCPLNHEVIFWFSTTSTAIATALFGWLALRVIRYGSLPRQVARQRHARELALIALIAALIPSFYEQVSAATAGIGLLAIGAGAGLPLRVRLARATAVTAVCGTVALGFVIALVLTAPASSRGGISSFTALDELPNRVHAVIRAARWSTIGTRGSELLDGSVAFGTTTLRSPHGLLTLAILASSAIAFLAVWIVTTRDATPCEGRRTPASTPRLHAMYLAGFLGVALVASFLPVALIDGQNMEMRTLYLPLATGFGLVALALDALIWRWQRASHLTARITHTFTSVLVGAAVVVLCGVGVVGLVGMQSGWQARYRLDQRELAGIKAAVPVPPPDAVFAVLANDALATRSGRYLFDTARPGVLQTSWSATSALRTLYRRGDVSCSPFNPWVGHAQFDRINAEQFRVPVSVTKGMPDHPAGGQLIRWDQIIPFIVDHKGRVFLTPTVIVERPDFRDFTVQAALALQAHKAASTRKRPPRAAIGVVRDTAARSPEAAGYRRAPDPRWHSAAAGAEGGALAEWWTIAAWGAFHEAAQLHPTIDAARRSGLLINVEHSGLRQTVLFRATVREIDMPDRLTTQRVRLIVEELLPPTVGGEQPRCVPRAEVDLSPSVFRRERRWFPVIIDLPPLDGAASSTVRRLAVRIAIEPGAEQPTDSAGPPVWVTKPWIATEWTPEIPADNAHR